MAKWLITGGSGFVGQNTALKLLGQGHEVVLADIRQPSVQSLVKYHVYSDIRRSFHELTEIIGSVPDVILHAAAQTAVTKSVDDPILDMETNVLGTINVLSWAASLPSKPLLIYMSTNKVYGELEDLDLALGENENSYYRVYSSIKAFISEQREPDPVTPYGISKYAGELYCKEFTRLYGLPTIILRCSCIYGPNQHGSFHQGWVDHLITQAVYGRLISICGNGKQVRDILYIDDLIDLYIKIFNENQQVVKSGYDQSINETFNVGGGEKNGVSILELINVLADLKLEPKFTFEDRRSGDQKYYISNITKVANTYEWAPSVNLEEKIEAIVLEKLKQRENLTP